MNIREGIFLRDFWHCLRSISLFICVINNFFLCSSVKNILCRSLDHWWTWRTWNPQTPHRPIKNPFPHCVPGYLGLDVAGTQFFTPWAFYEVWALELDLMSELFKATVMMLTFFFFFNFWTAFAITGFKHFFLFSLTLWCLPFKWGQNTRHTFLQKEVPEDFFLTFLLLLASYSIIIFSVTRRCILFFVFFLSSFLWGGCFLNLFIYFTSLSLLLLLVLPPTVSLPISFFSEWVEVLLGFSPSSHIKSLQG